MLQNIYVLFPFIEEFEYNALNIRNKHIISTTDFNIDNDNTFSLSIK